MKKEVLQELGLSEKESALYLRLLAEKSCNASRLARLTGINRSTVYLELENLIKKGLVSYLIKDSKRYYQAADPKKLIEILDTKKSKVKKILPELDSLHKSIQPFKFEIYEGKSGIKTFYQDILNNKSDVCAFGVTGKAFEVLRFEFPHFLDRFDKAGLNARYLANKSGKLFLEDLPESRVKIRYLPKKFSSEITTIIYDDKVAIQSLVEENLFVIIITDKKLAQGYGNYFEFMWESART